MSGFTCWTGQWPGSVDAIDCDTCAGIFDPPCPFHPDATPLSVLIEGFRRFVQPGAQAMAEGQRGEQTMTIYDEVRAERERAHAKHGDTSMEASLPDTLRRLAILSEEVGEVAREFNDAEHDHRPVDLARLRKELIQTAAMAAAWADAIVPA